MIQRERAASGDAEAVLGPARNRQAPAPQKGDGAALKNRAPVWEDLYKAISPGQQRELLSLAQRQGILYTDQLPVMPNGATPDAKPQALAQILGGDLAALEPLHAPPIEVDDPELDAVQREAIARALATPEIFLLQGRPGSGKSRVVAGIIACAAARGERVLLLAPNSAAIDRVLEWVAFRDVVFPIRCADRDEDLPPSIRHLTFAERARCLTAHALDCARRQIEADQQRAFRLRQDEAVWNQLDEICSQWSALENQRQTIQGQRNDLASVVAQQVEAQLAELRRRIEGGQQEQALLDAQVHGLHSLVEAKQRGRWWTINWWRATFGGKTVLTEWEEQQQRCRDLQADLKALREQEASLNRQRAGAERLFISAEITRKQAELDDQETAVRREQEVLEQKWQTGLARLAAETPRPIGIATQACQTARSAWRGAAEQAEAQEAFARQWVAYLEQTPLALTGRLPDYVNLVAATIPALPHDNHFGDRARAGAVYPDFDLLILEEADQVSEADFLQVARRAHRCVLIGEAGWPDDNPQAHGSGVRPRAAVPRAGVFQRLWQHLHCDPRHLPYVWAQDQNRLCCRLRPLKPDERQWLAIEHVADFPDIELRILTAPGGQPTLAEIIFPPAFSIDRAKAYIFQELQELAVQTSGSSLRWLEREDRLVLRLAERDLAHGAAIQLVPGVREILGAMPSEANGHHNSAAGWQTCCLEFDCSAGWNRARAAEWVREHLGLCDWGRTLCLDVCYRMETNLAAFIGGFLDPNSSNGVVPSRPAAVEFVPVPKLPESGASPIRGKGAKQHGVSSRVPALSGKGGTGLEIDLADPRQRERLPSDVRTGLPTHGFVNHPEAQAVVQTIVRLEKELGLRERRGERCQSGKQPIIAVVALYPAQAELIRRLLRQEPALAALNQEVQVGLPSTFRHREADVVLLSLTRSHTHRAVTFGDGPQMLALAMTRARFKLIVFGDVGTLARRSQWEGPLGHLGEPAAARERQLITRLVHCLQGCGSDLETADLHPR